MPHAFEPALSRRSKCRGCGLSIARGTLRFGERLPNLFAEGEMVIWFHPGCAAWKRPQPVLDALAETADPVDDRDQLERVARASLSHRRRPRIDGAERSPSGQANCRSCHQRIERGTWRIRIVFYEEGRFAPGGFVHLDCRRAYFETDDVLEQLLHFSPALTDDEREDLKLAFATPPPPPEHEV